MTMELPRRPDDVWPLLLDFQRIAACIPGCEQVEELAPLAHYKAVMKQKIGPFKLEVPAEIHVDEMLAPSHVLARATGRDKFTGTSFTVKLGVYLRPEPAVLEVQAELSVAGRLASLGYGTIRKKAEENFTLFSQRLQQEVTA